MIPGMIGKSTPSARAPLDQAEVVRGPEEHLGDREVGAGVVLAPHHPRVVLQRRRVAVPLGERRHPDPEVAVERVHQLDQLGGVVEAALGRRPTACRARPAGRRAAPARCARRPRRRRRRIAAQLLGGVADAGQVRHRRHRGLAGDPRGDPDRALAGGAAGAVRHRDERRAQRLELADRLPQHALALLVLGREELEGERLARPRPAGHRSAQGPQACRERIRGLRCPGDTGGHGVGRAGAFRDDVEKQLLASSTSTPSGSTGSATTPSGWSRPRAPASSAASGSGPRSATGATTPSRARSRPTTRRRCVRACGSLELLHASALVHDDYMDASDVRRGRPATHREFDALHQRVGLARRPRAVRRRGRDPARRPAAQLGRRDAAHLRPRRRPGARRPGVLRPHAAARWSPASSSTCRAQARGASDVDLAMNVLRYKSAKYSIERPLHIGAALAGASADDDRAS